MSKNIVVFSDGTGNSASAPFKTNVWRLYQALDLTETDQIAMFDDGVGTSSFRPLQYLGLALGVGVKRNVVHLYKFLCRNYEPGDRIYGFGFSRGAFTIRVLNGLVNREGLISFTSEEELDRIAVDAYRAYRKAAFRKGMPWVWLLRETRDVATYLWSRATGARTFGDVRRETRAEGRGPGKIKVHFLGLWDTVAAYGLPIDELTRAVDRWVWPMTFAETNLPPNVIYARHALGLDDARRTFFPIPWTEPDPRPAGSLDNIKLLQVWFAGVHANVGGGYPDDSLAMVSLGWMIGEAQKKLLRFKDEVVDAYAAVASECGPIYDSRAGFGVFYRYHPRDAGELMGTAVPLVHESVVLRMALGNDAYAPIALPDKVDVLTPDNTVVPFAPAAGAAPQSTPMRQLHDAITTLTGSSVATRRQYLDDALDTVWWRRLLYLILVSLSLIVAAYPLIGGSLHEPVTDGVDAMFGAPISGLLLAINGFLPGYAEPWLAAIGNYPSFAIILGAAIMASLGVSALLQTRIHDRARWAWGVHARAGAVPLLRRQHSAQRRALRSLAVVFGGLTVTSVVALPSNTIWALALDAGLATATGVCLLLPIYLAKRSKLPTTSAPTSTPLLRFARVVRTNDLALMVYRDLTRTFLPMAALVVTAALLVIVGERIIFDVRSAVGGVCTGSPDFAKLPVVDSSHPVWRSPEQRPFTTNSVCWPAGMKVVEGARYRIRLVMPPDLDWFDRTVPTDVEGFPASDMIHTLFTPAKRWWAQNWFKPIARIGAIGSDEYVLDPIVPLPALPDLDKPARPEPEKTKTKAQMIEDALDLDKSGTFVPISRSTAKTVTELVSRDAARRTLVAEFTARRSGELFLYLNDSVPVSQWDPTQFYTNNFGSAEVTVELVMPPSASASQAK